MAEKKNGIQKTPLVLRPARDTASPGFFAPFFARRAERKESGRFARNRHRIFGFAWEPTVAIAGRKEAARGLPRAALIYFVSKSRLSASFLNTSTLTE